MIQAQELSKCNGGKKAVIALHDVAADIGKGEFVSIVGPSGSCKTTLLLCLGGLIQPTRGRVLIGGECFYDRKSASAPGSYITGKGLSVRGRMPNASVIASASPAAALKNPHSTQ
jgi:ABC-type Fe3+/spermidine/putrescine transport system ATPase subunit